MGTGQRPETVPDRIGRGPGIRARAPPTDWARVKSSETKAASAIVQNASA
jgi:hypothetical protein